MPVAVGGLLRGANNPDVNFWNTLDQVIEHLAPNWFAIRGLLTGLQQRNSVILYRLRNAYQTDVDLVLGYPGRVDEDTQREVIRLIDAVVAGWNDNRPRMLE